MDSPDRDHDSYQPRVNLSYCPAPPDPSVIFRELIAAELRAGRLTRGRRARIVRYASQLGLSAAEAGRLITECHQEALQLSDDSEPELRFQSAAGPPRRTATSSHFAIITGILVIVIWLIR
jgi:hypothetical protein